MKKEDLKKGTILKIGRHKHKILAVVDYLYFLSEADRFNRSGNSYTIDDLELFGYEVKPRREFKKGDRVLVRDNNEGEFARRYFSHYANGRYHCFVSGADEWGSKGKTVNWRHCELAEDE